MNADAIQRVTAALRTRLQWRSPQEECQGRCLSVLWTTLIPRRRTLILFLYRIVPNAALKS